MALDIGAYQSQTRKITFKLTGGTEVEGAFYPNYMTGKAMKALMEATKDEDAPMTAHEGIVMHLAKSLADLDLTSAGSKVPFESEAEKRKALALLSINDLNLISSQITTSLQSFLETTGTD